MDNDALFSVWSHAQNNHEEIRRSNSCKCLICRMRFAPSEITQWSTLDRGIVEKNPLGKRKLIDGAQAICPYCQEPWVIGDASGYPLNDAEFIAKVREVGPMVMWDVTEQSV